MGGKRTPTSAALSSSRIWSMVYPAKEIFDRSDDYAEKDSSISLYVPRVAESKVSTIGR